MKWTQCVHTPFGSNMKILAISLLIFQLQQVLCSISDEKCKEYAGLYRKRQFDVNDWLNAFTSIPLPGKVPTIPGEFPHVVQLGYGNADDKMWACAGTLISDQYILTAASCETLEFLSLMSSRRRKRLFIQELINKPISSAPVDSRVEWIRVGDKIHGLQEIKVKEIILHPDMKLPQFYNDIALIKLDEKVTFGKFVRPACLYSGTDKSENDTVIITGWGAKRFGEYFSDDQMKVEMEIYSNEECNTTIYQAVTSIFDKGVEAQLCVGSHNERKALCIGDGGAPLQMKNEKYSNMHDIIGITSIGYFCNFPRSPVIATKVSSYIPWIESIVWPTKN